MLDDASRENEGDLIISAAHMTAAQSAFLIRHSSGYLCAPLSAARAQHLDLPPMLPLSANSDPNRTNYTLTVDAADNVTTGISALDRSTTCRLLANENATKESFRRPGHVVPLVARAGGVRERRGHTEATWEFARLAGVQPEVGVIGELVKDGEREADGSPGYADAGMMRAKDCVEFGRKWGIRCCTIEDLVQYVEKREGKLDGEPVKA